MSAAGERGVHHLAILVRDLPRVEAFYRDVLGLAVIRRDGARSVWLDLGPAVGPTAGLTPRAFLALEAAPAPAGSTRAEDAPGLHMFALAIAPGARTAWERRLANAAVPIVHRTAFTLYVRDPEGNGIGLSHWPDPAPEAID